MRSLFLRTGPRPPTAWPHSPIHRKGLPRRCATGKTSRPCYVRPAIEDSLFRHASVKGSRIVEKDAQVSVRCNALIAQSPGHSRQKPVIIALPHNRGEDRHGRDRPNHHVIHFLVRDFILSSSTSPQFAYHPRPVNCRHILWHRLWLLRRLRVRQ